MSCSRAAERCADALAILDGLLREGLAEDATPDIVAAAGLIEEALEELGGGPLSPAAALFAPMGWLP